MATETVSLGRTVQTGGVVVNPLWVASPGSMSGSSDVYITQAGELADRFIIGQGGTIHKLTIESGGSLTTDSGTDHRIGQTSEGWIIMNGGTLNVQNGGYSSDAGGRLIINDGDVDFGANSSVGNTSAGFLEINGSTATIDVNGAYTFGRFQYYHLYSGQCSRRCERGQQHW